MSSSKVTLKKYFYKEKLLLKIFGISFTGNESIFYKIYSCLIIFPFNFTFSLLEFMEVFKHEFEVVADMIIYVFATFISVCKTAVVLQNRIVIGKMLDKLEREPFIVNPKRGGNQEEKLVGSCLRITNIQNISYWTFGMTTVISTMAYTGIRRLMTDDSQKWELPYGPLTVLNTTYSPNFEITWLYANMSVLSIFIHFTTTDLLIATVLAHISCQFKLLQNAIGRMTTKSYKLVLKDDEERECDFNICNVDGSTIPWKYLHKSLKEVVLYHIAILELAKDMEEVFSGLLLTIFLGTLGMLCFLIYNASMIKGDVAQTLRSVGEITTACSQVGIVCYWGEQIIFQSQEVGKAAFETKFSGTDVRFQKGLALIIRRSQNPTAITAGKFADICLTTFVWILRTSYSSFMVLRGS